MRAPRLRTRIRRDQIAAAAVDLIAAGGMKALSISAVARRVGLAPSAIYRHFPGRDAVVDAALEQMRARLLGNVAAVREESDDALERLHLLLRRHLQLVRFHQAFPRVVFSEDVYAGHGGRRAHAYDMLRSYLDGVADICREGQRRGTIRRGLEPRVLAMLMVGIVQPAAVLSHLSEGDFDAAGHAEKAWRALRILLEPAPASRRPPARSRAAGRRR